MKELPVIYPDAFQEKAITKMVNKVLELKAASVPTKEKETAIDACVYNLCNLSFERSLHHRRQHRLDDQSRL